ncbi:MAG: hypothetical protein IJM89_07930 [Bacteroidales bacterium]|nr:hypothetical protein [Bacteroidales bacterium]MBQ1693992.1 hypothetical protein [Bacteroidales bacterium]MBQ4169246.1 hypothetical protein [Bacteroidales bacterium]MBQ5415615.1 hypothetical protein [Bacteroidales bacterium]MBQ7073274.1 hypothetical protein [Bacteroidales bacterium]
MRTFLVTLLAIAFVLYLAGAVWSFIAKKNELSLKTPNLLKTIALLMLIVGAVIIVIRGLQ